MVDRTNLFYILGCVFFFLLTLGPTTIFMLLTLAVAFIIGVIAYLLYDGHDRRVWMRRRYAEWIQQLRFCDGLAFAKENFRFSDASIYTERHSMTNSELLDPILEQILDNIINDIDSWYCYLTTDKLFPASLKRTARRSIMALRSSLSKVDWLPLLTRHFVDDFASHLRLYRKAKERLEAQRERDNSGPRQPSGPADDLESLFFDLELEMEKSYCRDLVSTSPAYESAYLHDISDVLLYLLMPSEDFRCRPLRFLVREVLVTKVFVPLLDQLSDPCFVNRMIVWLLSELPISTDDFISIVGTCRCVQELEAILESVHEEQIALRSKGGGTTAGEQSNSIFSQQLSSLEFLEKLIRSRMLILTNKLDEEQTEQQIMNQKVNSTIGKQRIASFELAEDASSAFENSTVSNGTAFPVLHLPLHVVLTHPVALSHFVEYLTQVGGQNYIDFYLAIEGFKVSMEHQIRLLTPGQQLDADARETLREAALFMYHQYLSQQAITRVPLGDAVVNKFLARLRNDRPSEEWFEQIQQKVIEILRTEERFYPAFKGHPLYEKMLEELGIGCTPETAQSVDGAEDIEEEEHHQLEELAVLTRTASSEFEENNHFMEAPEADEDRTTVLVEMLGGRHLFALYNVRVTKANGKGGSSSNVIRRYSDFHALHNLILSKFPKLRTLSFPGKKTFNNLDQDFLDKRCRALNQYMNCILQPTLLEANPGLEHYVFDFLSQKRYTASALSAGREHFPKAMGTMFSGALSGVKAFGSAAAAMPSDLIDGIGSGLNKMGTELNKAASSMLKGNPARQRMTKGRCNSTASTSNLPDFSRVAADIDENDSAENIPLRVLLLVVDEVFGLRAKNQWFRRRLVSVLRQVVHAALGNSINRRIVEAVQWLTSEEQVAQYLIALRDSIWGDGSGAFSAEALQQNALHTRLMARYLMLTAVPDQLRLFIGATAIQTGVQNVSEVLQNRHLNRRYWYVLLERLLVTLFPRNSFDRLLPQLHAKSPRTQMAEISFTI